MVPVTTKPYLNSVNFTILQQGVPAFFLLIKEKTNQHITSCEIQDFSKLESQCILVFKLGSIPLRFVGIIRLTNLLYYV